MTTMTTQSDVTLIPADEERLAAVRYWSVYEQHWIESCHPSDADLASMPAEDRERVIRHLGIGKR